MKRRIFIFFFISLVGWLISCNSPPVAHSLNKAENHPTPSESEKTGDNTQQKLSSVLYELALSPDPEYYAKQHNILLDNHRVRVFIILEPSSPDPEREKVFEDHNIRVEKRSGDMVRGLVAVDRLIPLSEEPVIQFIRLPDRLIKTRNIHP